MCLLVHFSSASTNLIGHWLGRSLFLPGDWLHRLLLASEVPPHGWQEAGLFLPPPPAEHVTLTLSPSPSINLCQSNSSTKSWTEMFWTILDLTAARRRQKTIFVYHLVPSEDSFSIYGGSAPPPVPYKASNLSVVVPRSRPFPKLSLVGKSRRAIDRKSSDVSFSESSKLSRESGRCYSSGSHKTNTSLHFTLLFSPAEGKLTVTVLGLYRGSRKLSGTTVKACLSPICLAPIWAALSAHSLGPEAPAQVFQLQVKSAEELQSCTLRLTVSSRDFSGLRETALGELELPCAEIHWEPDCTVTFNRQINPARRRLRKVLCIVYLVKMRLRVTGPHLWHHMRATLS